MRVDVGAEILAQRDEREVVGVGVAVVVVGVGVVPVGSGVVVVGSLVGVAVTVAVVVTVRVTVTGAGLGQEHVTRIDCDVAPSLIVGVALQFAVWGATAAEATRPPPTRARAPTVRAVVRRGCVTCMVVLLSVAVGPGQAPANFMRRNVPAMPPANAASEPPEF